MLERSDLYSIGRYISECMQESQKQMQADAMEYVNPVIITTDYKDARKKLKPMEWLQECS